MKNVISYEDAQKLGINRYFTGVPCKRGHISERTTDKRECVQCRDERAAKWAIENPGKIRANKRKYYDANLDLVKERVRVYAQANQDQVREYKRKYQAKNADEEADRLRKYRQDNASYVAQYMRQYQDRNRLKIKYQKRQYRIAHPEVHRASSHNRRAREIGADGNYTAEDVLAINERQNHKCFYCGASTENSYHVDHYIALSKGGSNFPENLRIACQPCNSKKHDKDPIRFIAELVEIQNRTLKDSK